jgi:hypothetical protein
VCDVQGPKRRTAAKNQGSQRRRRRRMSWRLLARGVFGMSLWRLSLVDPYLKIMCSFQEEKITGSEGSNSIGYGPRENSKIEYQVA